MLHNAATFPDMAPGYFDLLVEVGHRLRLTNSRWMLIARPKSDPR
jgi:hypothetical protein